MKLYLVALGLAFLAASAFASGLDDIPDSDLDSDARKLIQLEPESASDQEEPRTSAESEGDDDDDKSFDDELCLDSTSRPKQELPDSATFQKIYESQINNVEGLDSTTKIGTIEYNPKFVYWNPLTWYPVWKCCPRVFNYGCRSASKRLGVFRHWYNYRTEWCYPIWPVYVKRCLCSECLIRDPWCPRRGRCNRRYTRRSFLAICNRAGNYWSYIRYIRNKWLPSSCYCRANKYIYTQSLEKSCSN